MYCIIKKNFIQISERRLCNGFLIEAKRRVIVMSRELTAKKKLYEEMVDLPLEPAKIRWRCSGICSS